jgi:trimethylamine--corrinoid protein Co-methyltransferase
MRAQIQVLSVDECAEIHDRSLKVLSKKGVRVESETARKILKKAGAEVDENSRQVCFPRSLVEEALYLTPTKFKLGGRRPGWNLSMNSGQCKLVADGAAVSVLDYVTGETHPGTFEDWLKATHLIDSIDEIGVYWNMVEGGLAYESTGDFIAYYRNTFKNCSKHIQDSVDSPQKANLLMEILQIIFGDQKTIASIHPFSYLLCPMSPLVIDETYTNAYLETVGWNIPVAIMPMPLMGMTSPASLISTVLQGNCEVLAMLCLVQAAAPGTPCIYAPVAQSIEPRTWRYTGGAIENSLLGAAVTELGQSYGLPVEASTGGTDQYFPGVQANYERAINWTLPTMAYPDLLVGPGLFGGSTIFCLEQMIIDVEIFRRCERLYEGISTDTEKWLDDNIASLGPGNNYLNQKSTLMALREGRWYTSEMGFHDTYEKWIAAGQPDIIEEIHEKTEAILKNYQPLPMDPLVEAELVQMEKRLRAAER